MPDNSVLYGNIIYALPTLASAICLAVLLIYSRSRHNPVPRNLMATSILTYALYLFSWPCMNIYLLWPKLFVVIQSLFYFSFCFSNVTMYRIIFLLTGTGRKEKFPLIHTILPAIIPAVLFIWSLTVPMDIQVGLVESRGQLAAGYEAYSRLFLSKPVALLTWLIVYALLTLRRILHYRREIPNFSADQGRLPVGWMMQVFWLKITLLLLPVTFFIFGRTTIMTSVFMVIPVFLISMQLVVLCYNIVAENYIIITETDNAGEDSTTKGRKIDKERLERYIRSKKPYLNPKLRITDMAADLQSNRTYLSNFINAEYGMNFSRWINRMRLKELDRMSTDPTLRDQTGMELVIHAGFTNYRAYLRAKQEEDRASIIRE